MTMPKLAARMLIHFSSVCSPHAKETTPAGQQFVGQFLDRGWIERSDNDLYWKVTQRGAHIVNAMVDAPGLVAENEQLTAEVLSAGILIAVLNKVALGYQQQFRDMVAGNRELRKQLDASRRVVADLREELNEDDPLVNLVDRLAEIEGVDRLQLEASSTTTSERLKLDVEFSGEDLLA